MSGSESKPKTIVKEVVKEVESEESKQYKELFLQLDKQLAEIKNEVHTLQPIIQEGIKMTFSKEKDAVVIKYEDLTDKGKLVKNIEKVFVKFPQKDFLVETAQAMVEAMASTNEMSELMRWKSWKAFKTINGKVYGMELQYKVKLFDETKKGYIKHHTQTTLMIAYKCIAHVMESFSSDCPTDEELKMLTF